MSAALFEFETPAGRIALPCRLARRVERVDHLEGVPGAHEAIAGVAEAGGGVVTLIDPAFFLERAASTALVPAPPSYVLLLAPPFAQIALLLGPDAELVRCEQSEAPLVDEKELERTLKPARRPACP